MIRYFRSGNPLTVLLLLIYTIFLKFYYLLHPSTYLTGGSEGLLYTLLVNWLKALVGNSPLFFTTMAILLQFVQALLFNKIINYHRLFAKPNYLPAMTYLLFTSLLDNWSAFSPVLLVNLIMLWVFSSLTDLYSRTSVRDVVFNTGFAIGVAALLYFPSVVFLLLLLISLLIMRAFRLAEWIIGLMGLICPIYLLGTYLFLTDRWSMLYSIPNIGLANPFVNDYKVWGATVVCLLFLVAGWVLLQRALKKMLIQGRKIWSVSLVFVLVALVVPFFSVKFTPAYWLVAVLPISMFGANVFWSIRNNTIANAVHILVLGYVLLMQYFT